MKKKIALVLALIMVGCCIFSACNSKKWSDEVLDYAEKYAEYYIEIAVELENSNYDVEYVSGNATEQTNSNHYIAYIGNVMVVSGNYDQLYTAVVNLVLEYDENSADFSIINFTVGNYSPVG